MGTEQTAVSLAPSASNDDENLNDAEKAVIGAKVRVQVLFLF
jgi:hypothetical protein